MEKKSFPEVLRALYEPLRVLGQGGMGTVWAAKDLRSGEKVAIKVLLPHLRAEEDFIDRFQREAHTGSQIAHPGLVPVIFSGIKGETAFIVSQFVDGLPLDKILAQEGHLEEGAAIDVVLQVARALGALHEINIVHRDIKPENIIIQRNGKVKVLDFGLARCLESGQTVTATGVVLGTPVYMSPEACCGHSIAPQADVFSMGILLVACLEGINAVAGEETSPLALLKSRAIEQKTPTLSSSFSMRLRHIVKEATAFAPKERFTDGTAFAKALLTYRDYSESKTETDFADSSKSRTADEQTTVEVSSSVVQKETKPEVKKVTVAKRSKTPLLLALAFVLAVFLARIWPSEHADDTYWPEVVFITTRQGIILEDTVPKKEQLSEFGKQLRHFDDSYAQVKSLNDEQVALAYLAKFLEKSWRNKEGNDKTWRQAHRCATFYLQLFAQLKTLNSSELHQQLLNSLYDACCYSGRFPELQERLRALELLGTIDYARKFYLARSIFTHTERNEPPKHDERARAADGYFEVEPILRPLVERLTRGGFEPPLIHLNTKQIIETFAYLHAKLRTKASKRSLLQVTKKLAAPGSSLPKDMKIYALIRCESELLRDNRGRKIDDPFVTEEQLVEAGECIRRAQSLCTDKRQLNELNFLEANVYRRRDKFKEAYAALEKVNPSILYDSTTFEYHIKKGYILIGLTRYGEACTSFKLAQQNGKSQEDKEHALLQFEKARIQHAYELKVRGNRQ